MKRVYCISNPDWVNDIALIKLKKPVKFDETTSPVCLPERNQMVPDGTSAYVAGWARLKNDVNKITLMADLD